MGVSRELLALTKRAILEEWSPYKIMAEMTMVQKEIDANLMEELGHSDLAQIIRMGVIPPEQDVTG